MKKVIEGICYDKENSEYICETSNEISSSDFEYERSHLYRTKNGRYFLIGRGGALSRFAVDCGKGRRGECSYDTILALPEADARRLVELHGEYDDYVQCFGEPPEA